MKGIFAAIGAFLRLLGFVHRGKAEVRSVEFKADPAPASEFDDLPTETGRVAIVAATHDHEAAILGGELLAKATVEQIRLTRVQIDRLLQDDDHDSRGITLDRLATELDNVYRSLVDPGQDLLESVQSIERIDREVRALWPHGWNVPGMARPQQPTA